VILLRHETITQTYISGVRRFLARPDAALPLVEKVNALLRAPEGRRDARSSIWPLGNSQEPPLRLSVAASFMSLPFFTIGHSTRPIPDFVDLLRVGGVQTVIDIRTVPRSRTNPHYNADVLGNALAEYQIGYGRIPALGGLRSRARNVPPELNGWWENRSFHNYADYALSPEFRQGLEELVALGRERRTAVMCSEAVWWRCHRRIVADYLLAAGEAVFHLMEGGRAEPARLSPGAAVADRTLTYPARAAGT
jgi:hypothetical protein